MGEGCGGVGEGCEDELSRNLDVRVGLKMIDGPIR